MVHSSIMGFVGQLLWLYFCSVVLGNTGVRNCVKDNDENVIATICFRQFVVVTP